MELQDWRKELRKKYSNEFKLRMVELASQPGACVAQIARENGVNDNVIFKWLRLWQNEGRVSRRLPVTTSSDVTNGAKVIRTERVKKACTKCDCIVEAPAPSRPIERGIAGPGLLARVLMKWSTKTGHRVRVFPVSIFRFVWG